MSEFERDAMWSEKTLNQVVWPAIKRAVGGSLISVEGDSSNIARQIDISSGIDAFIKTEHGIKSVASRVQRCRESKPWNTFTIRAARNTGAKTEWEKRCNSIKSNDSLYPMLTMQAYVSEPDDTFASAAIIRTDHLYQYAIAEHDHLEIRRTVNAVFYLVRWSRLKNWIAAKNIHSSMYIFNRQMAFNELVN